MPDFNIFVPLAWHIGYTLGADPRGLARGSATPASAARRAGADPSTGTSLGLVHKPARDTDVAG